MTKQYSPREIADWLRGMKLHSVYADLYEAAAQAVERTPLAKHEDALNAVLGPPAEPGADSQGLRDARYLIGMLIAEAGGRVVIRRDTMVNFDVRQSLESRDDPESGDRIYTLKLPVNRGAE